MTNEQTTGRRGSRDAIMRELSRKGIDRREFLRKAGGTGLFLLGGPALLAACGVDGSETSTTLAGTGTNRIVNSSAASGELTLNLAGDMTLTGILGTAGQENFGLTKTGAGKLTLGVNAYSGNTTVNEGTLELTALNQLNAAADLTVGGGTLDDLAEIHDGHLVGKVLDDGEVVSDEEVAESELILEVG